MGAAVSVTTLAAAALTAVAINDLAAHRVGRGVVTLALSLLARAGVGAGFDEWGQGSAARVRHHWRHILIDFFARPRGDDEAARGDIALAIDHAAGAPALESLKVAAATSLVGVVAVFWAAGWWALLINLGLLALAIPLYRRAGKRSELAAATYQGRRRDLEQRQLDVLRHGPELRALGAVDYGADEIAALSDNEHASALSAVRVALASTLVTEFLSGVSIGLVAMVTGFALLGGRLSLLRALVAVLVTGELFSHVRRFGTEFHRRDDAERARATLGQLPVSAVTPFHEELIEAQDLVTAATTKPVTFALARGDRLAITGPSGVGKTTLLHTLLGWRAPISGSVRRREARVGYVAIESALVSGSLRENLCAGVAHSDLELRNRLDSLGLSGARFVDLDATLLAEGRGLSSGERVRIVLARALLAEPALLVVDDIAGAFDEASRELVARALLESNDLAVVEASSSRPLLITAARLELG